MRANSVSVRPVSTSPASKRRPQWMRRLALLQCLLFSISCVFALPLRVLAQTSQVAVAAAPKASFEKKIRAAIYRPNVSSFSRPHSVSQIASPPSLRSETPTLLDEVGQLGRNVPDTEVTGWRIELTMPTLSASRRALLNLWLGEWNLAKNQAPRQAAAYFATAQRSSKRTDNLYGLAAYDLAITSFYEGAYEEAAEKFRSLLSPKARLTGFDGKTCSLWLRHAGACAGYHAERAKIGIPEPPRLDPLCGAAALATCLQSQKRPFDKQTLLGAMHITGRGSSLQDIINAAMRLGVSAHSITTDEEGLKALPKPLVAYVEHDHFVALVRADNKGVSYLCSDCGPWPGGRVNLTWKQWRKMECSTFAAVVAKGSVWDNVLAKLPRQQQTPKTGVQLTAARLANLHLESLTQQATLLSLLAGHVVQYLGPPTVTCGYTPTSQHCTPLLNACPMAGGSGCSRPGGPSAPDPVNLATGEEEYSPEPDFYVYNPYGPSVYFSRIYNSLRGYDPTYDYFDFGAGWSHNYNMCVQTSGGHFLVMPNGARISFSVPNPTYPGSGADAVASYYQHATILACSSPGFHGKISAEYASSDQNAPIVGYWVTWADHTISLFYNNVGGDPTIYKLSRICGRTWIYNANTTLPYTDSIVFGYQLVHGTPHLSVITDGNSLHPHPLLVVERDPNNNSFITWVHDTYSSPRGVAYLVSTQTPSPVAELVNVYQIGPYSSTYTPTLGRYSYRYTPYYNGRTINNVPEMVPLLTSIIVPSPNGTSMVTETANIDYTTDGTCYVTKLTDANGNTQNFTAVTTPTNTTKVTVKENAAHSYQVDSVYSVSYNTQMAVTGIKDGNGAPRMTAVYSTTNYQPDSIQDGNGGVTQFLYDFNGTRGEQGVFINQITSPRGTHTIYGYAYDPDGFSLGQVISIQPDFKLSTLIGYWSDTNHTPTYSYSGLVGSVQTPRPGGASLPTPRVTTLYYYNGGTLTGEFLTEARLPQFNGKNYTSVDNIWDITYNGRKPATIYNKNSIWSFTYDNYNNLQTVTDFTNRVTTYYHDTYSDQVIGVTFPTQDPTRQVYQHFGYAYPAGPLTYQEKGYYNSNTGATSIANAITPKYGNEGEILNATGDLNSPSVVYDAVYRPVAYRDGNNNPFGTYYAYDPNTSNLTSVTYPNGDTTVVNSYDLNGNPTQITDGRGTVTHYAYYNPTTSQDSQLTSITYDGNAGFNVTLQYDNYGRVTNVADMITGSRTCSYDNNDLLTEVDTALISRTGGYLPTQKVIYEYNDDSSRADVQFTNDNVHGYTFYYLYDLSGRLQKLTNPSGQLFTFDYLPNDWLQDQKYGNVAKTAYTYDGPGRVTDLLTSSQAGTNPAYSHYANMTYDALSDRLGMTASMFSPAGGAAVAGYGGTVSYTYDVSSGSHTKGQLTQEMSSRVGGYTSNYAYDGAGNTTILFGSNYTFNTSNQFTAHTYDHNGNELDWNGLTLGYDVNNKLSTIPGKLSAGYYSDGQRAWKQNPNNNGYLTYFIYDVQTGKPLYEVDNAGAITAINTFGPNGLMARHSQGATNPLGTYDFYYTFDPAGNLAQVLDTNGNVLDTAVTSAYGSQVTTAVGTDPFLGFGGKWGYYHDYETGLYLLGQRYYDSAQARFLNRDSIGYSGGQNLYAFAGNNPLIHGDPSGLTCADNDDGSPAFDNCYLNDLQAGDHPGLQGASNFVNAAINIIPGGGLIPAAAGIDSYGCKLSLGDRIENAGQGLASLAGALEAAAAFGSAGLAAAEPEAVPWFSQSSSCFVAGTPVQMADKSSNSSSKEEGSTTDIEQIKAGMIVATRNPDTGKTESRKVVRTFKHTTYELISLDLADSNSGKVVERLQGTPQHPFFTPSGMVAMGDLKPEMKVITRRGPPMVVKSITREQHPEGIPVYNFEVEGDHTYFVGSVQRGIWVHNECTDKALWMQRKLGGGDIYRVEPYMGRRNGLLSPENGYEKFQGMWGHHDVLIYEGNVYDPMMQGKIKPWIPFEEWVKRWDLRFHVIQSWTKGMPAYGE